MTTNDIHELHGVEFRRTPEWPSGWECRQLPGEWFGLDRFYDTHKALIGVLEERFPKPRTVTLPTGVFVHDGKAWRYPENGAAVGLHHFKAALNELDRIQNGDPDGK